MKATVTASQNHRRHQSLSSITLLHLRRDSSSLSVPPLFSPSRSTNPVNDLDVEFFQRQVSGEFHVLHASSSDLLSIAWIQKLLESFLRCQESFQNIILKNRGQQSLKPPADRILSELNDRMIKALDVVTGTRDGTDQIRDWVKLVEIVLCALEGKKNLLEGHLQRAKKALTTLSVMDSTHMVSSHRSRQVLSLSWNISRGWSVAKQIHAIDTNLSHPKGSEVVSTNGLAMAIYTMGFVLLFVMWVLEVSIPCRGHGVTVHFTAPPRQFGWGVSLSRLSDLIMEESKSRKDGVLLREVRLMRECAGEVGESMESCPGEAIGDEVESLRSVFEVVKEGLGVLEGKVGEVVHKIVTTRNEEHEILSPQIRF